MTTQLPLIPDCPPPGCRNITEDPRLPCPECMDALGPRIRPAESPQTPEEFQALRAIQDQRLAEVLAERAAFRAQLRRYIREPEAGS